MASRLDTASRPVTTRPVPTRRLVRWVAALTLVGFAVPLFAPLAAVWSVGVVVLALLVLADFLSRPDPNAVVVRRVLSRVDHVGRDGRYTLSVRSAVGARLQVALREVLPAAVEGNGLETVFELAPDESWSAEIEFSALRRGVHAFPGLGLGITAGLGLLEHRRRYADDDALRIAPGRPAGEIGWLLTRAAQLEEVGAVHVRRPGAEWEFESLRDYVVGDELRWIDWNASARRHRPIVRQFETERGAEVLLALDCGRLMGSLIDGVRKLDLAMTPVLDLAAVALRRGERVGLLAFDSKPRAYLPPRPGMAQLHAMTEAMAGLPECDEPTSYLNAIAHLQSRHRKRVTLIVLTDFSDEVGGREMMTGVAVLARRHQTVFVAVADPHLERIFDTPAESEEALFEKAVAGELRVERRAVLDGIRNLGVAAIDAEPQRLSGPLLNRYFALRLGGGG